MGSDNIDFDQIIEEFPLDTNSTESIRTFEGAQLLKVNGKNTDLIPSNVETGEIYILDSDEGRKIACHPHIVGKELESLCIKAASKFRRALEFLEFYPSIETGILHILRGGRGYMVADVMPSDIPVIDVRTEYTEDGYREHSDDSRDINVTYTSLLEKQSSWNISTLIIPDTVATGRSAEAAINRMYQSGFRLENIVLYGFISIPGLLKIVNLCVNMDIDVYSFAICDLTPLAWNNYDMPIYGLDEGLFEAEGRLQKLGSIIHPETLTSILPWYIAGLDQPGDWSERQLQLFNGNFNEDGDISGHCMKSLQLIESLDQINRIQSWYNIMHRKIAETESRKLHDTMQNY
jgi:hypothetical protein